MDLDGIREALYKQPFEQLVFRLADGRSLPVHHPDFVAVHPRRIIVIADDGSWSVLEPYLIASLDYAAPKKGGNGARIRKKPPSS